MAKQTADESAQDTSVEWHCIGSLKSKISNHTKHIAFDRSVAHHYSSEEVEVKIEVHQHFQVILKKSQRQKSFSLLIFLCGVWSKWFSKSLLCRECFKYRKV